LSEQGTQSAHGKRGICCSAVAGAADAFLYDAASGAGDAFLYAAGGAVEASLHAAGGAACARAASANTVPRPNADHYKKHIA